MKGKPRITQEEKDVLRMKRNKKRDNYEKKNLGGFELIFPSEKHPTDLYQPFLNFAK